MSVQKIIARQSAYYATDATEWKNNEESEKFPDLSSLLNLNLPKHNRYALCNLRGGIGKTTLTFNLAYDAEKVLVVDTCPQGNCTNYFANDNKCNETTIYDALLPFLLPRMHFPSDISLPVENFNRYFENKAAHFVPSSMNLYEFPSILESALSQARSIPGGADKKATEAILVSMRDLLDRETRKLDTKRVLVDTSPFFSGATHLTWHAVDSLIVPVRTDQQSIDSLELLIELLKKPDKSFLRARGDLSLTVPKIQMVILTHCGWSTQKNARNKPNNQTRVYLNKVYEVISNNIDIFTTQDPDNHLVPFDDLLGSGRIASAKKIPIRCLEPGKEFVIDKQKVSVNHSVEKCQKQLSFISSNIWSD